MPTVGRWIANAAERDRLVPVGHPGPVPAGGVGGSSGGVKCLHAHYADHAAGNANPIGEMVAPDVEPLDCTVPCVAERDGEVTLNPDWSEPPRLTRRRPDHGGGRAHPPDFARGVAAALKMSSPRVPSPRFPSPDGGGVAT